MALTVSTNMSALSASSAHGALSASLNSLSSGSQATSAADLAVGENLDAESLAIDQGMRNANDGISIIQTAEGSTNEVANILGRMRELAMQSASETLADSERAYIQTEYTQLVAEVDRIAGATEFNGVALSDGSASALSVQVGAAAEDAVGITLGDLRATALGIDLASVDLSTAGGAFAAIDDIDAAMDTVGGYRADYGSAAGRLGSSLSASSSELEALSSARSQIMDADFATASAEIAKNQIMQQAGVAALAQARSVNQSILALL